MPTWTDTFSHEDIQDKPLWDMFYDASLERSGASGSGVSAVTSHIASGQALLNARSFAGGYNSGTSLWIPPRVNHGSLPWTRVTDYAGEQWDETWAFNPSPSQIAVTLGRSAGDFTLKVEKIFSTTASTNYDASSGGGAAVNGDVGRCAADAALYTRTAGAWVLNAHPYVGDADLIDLGSSFVSPGQEVWGPWCLSEIRDVLNDMIWLFVGINADISNSYYVNAFNSADTVRTYASSKTDVSAEFADPANVVNSTTGGWGGLWGCLSTFDKNNSPQVQAELFSSQSVWVSDVAVIAAVPHKVQALFAPIKAIPSIDFAGTILDDNVFDDNGFGMTEGKLWQGDMTGSTSATSYTSPPIGDYTVVPAFATEPNLPTGMDPDHTTFRGFYVIQRLGLARFESGFTYKL